MQVTAPQPYFNHEPFLSVRHAVHRRMRRWWPLGLLLAVMALSAPAHALLSCNAAAKTIAGGASDSCVPANNKFEAVAAAPTGGAYVNAKNGSAGGSIFVTSSTRSGSFHGELVVDFRIDGPTPIGNFPVDFIFSGHGSITGDCINCDAELFFRHRIDGLSVDNFFVEARSGRKRNVLGGIEYIQNWEDQFSFYDGSGFNMNPSHSTSLLGDTVNGVVTFDAASVLGQTFRLTSRLQANAHVSLYDLPTAYAMVDSSNTSLFNIVLPDGYTLSTWPSGYPFLATPILQPIPEPAVVVQLLAGLGGIAIVLWKRRSSQKN